MIHRYPRTQHLEGSRLQPGDHDLDQVPLEALRGAYCVIEEKLDGANTGISLGEDGRLQLQSRGHVLTGGARERHWDLFKQWARTHEAAIAARIPPGATLYGEWLYAKHTVFYDQLPHFFLEFDIRDEAGAFWSTARRREHLAGAPIASVPVIWEGVVQKPAKLPPWSPAPSTSRTRGGTSCARPPWRPGSIRSAPRSRPIRATSPRASTSRSRTPIAAWCSAATSGSARRS